MSVSVSQLDASVEALRTRFSDASSRESRSEIGQFLTPACIAQFMASLFDRHVEHVRILDPGTGAGALFAACVAQLCNRKARPQSIAVVAYEIDDSLAACSAETMALCRDVCREAGVPFHGDVLNEDFIPAALDQTEYSLLASEHQAFTHAILNPPYKKLNGRSRTRKLLDAAGMGTSNLYAAFVWLAARMLEPTGELVAITPRSFCNGPYFRRFRMALLHMMSLRRIHVIESRRKAFGDDHVLQENVIFHAARDGRKSKSVAISSSEGADFAQARMRSIPYRHVVLPDDPDAFIHLVLSEADDRVMERMGRFATSLDELGVEVSTGRVVDFRAREHLRPQPENGTVPLIHPCHFEDGFVNWPAESAKKPNAILSSAQTRDLLVAAGHYVLTKRFTAKEERRRVVAAIYDPRRVKAPLVGFENHLNYFHAMGHGLSANLAKGLAAYLNSSLFDQYFRLFSGHTQVNATDVRKMRYPSREQLLRLGAHVKQRMPDQETVDAIVLKECESDG